MESNELEDAEFWLEAVEPMHYVKDGLRFYCANTGTRVTLAELLAAYASHVRSQVTEPTDEHGAAKRLKALVFEVAGCFVAFEDEIRDAISNTNYECIMQRVEEGRKFLSAPPAASGSDASSEVAAARKEEK